MELEIKGTIKTIEEVQTIGSGEKMFQKMYYVIDTGEQYDSEIAFEVFGQDKIEQFRKYNVVGDTVAVKFNIKHREYNGQHYTTLSSWRCTKNDVQTTEKAPVQAEAQDDLPF